MQMESNWFHYRLSFHFVTLKNRSQIANFQSKQIKFHTCVNRFTLNNIQHQRHHVRIHQSSLRRLLFIRHIKKILSGIEEPLVSNALLHFIIWQKWNLEYLCYNVLELFWKAHSFIQEIKSLLPNLLLFYWTVLFLCGLSIMTQRDPEAGFRQKVQIRGICSHT